MLKAVQKYFSEISPTFIDGILYVLIAVFGAMTASLSSDEAAKYIAPEWLFYMRAICSWGGAGLLALKMFRSTQYAEHMIIKTEEKRIEKNNTEFLKKFNGTTP